MKDTNTVYTFGEYDRKKLCTAIKALRYSHFSGVTLAKWIYQVAFTRTFTLSGTSTEILERICLHGGGMSEKSIIGAGEEVEDIATDLIKMTVPSLCGGRRYYTESKFDYRCTRLAKAYNLVPGDIVFARSSSSDKVYLYNGEVLLDLTDSMKEYDVNQMFERFLAWLRFYVVLRPSFVIK